MTKFRDRLLLANAVVMLLLLASNVAAHGGGVIAQIIHSCQSTSKGTLRIVAATANCNNGEVALDWNTVGPQGPQGPKGDTGSVGPQGLQGATKPQGPQGPQGPAGIASSAYANGHVHGPHRDSLADTPPDAFVFLGQQTTVNATAGQKLYMTGEATLGTSNSTPPAHLEYNMCVRLEPSGQVYAHNDAMFIQHAAPASQATYAVTKIYDVLQSGTYTVGFCYSTPYGGGSTWNSDGWSHVTVLVLN